MRGTQLHLFHGDDEKTGARRRAVSLPIDTLMLVSAVGALLLILSFSLGIEKGRRNAYRTIEKERQIVMAQARLAQNPPAAPAADPEEIDAPQQPATTPVRPLPLTKPLSAKPIAAATAAANVVVPMPVVNTASADKVMARKYLIQLASYQSREPAQAEAKKLQKNGYPVQLSQKGKFIVILVGEFKNETEAKNNLQTLKKQYKDCFLKKL